MLFRSRCWYRSERDEFRMYLLFPCWRFWNFLKRIQDAKVSQVELDQTKAALINEILCALDDPRGVLELSIHRVLSGNNRTFDQWIEKIKEVTKEDVIRVSKRIEYMGSYYLKGEIIG